VPTHEGLDIGALTEASRRAVLRLFVRRGLLEPQATQSMSGWPNEGLHVHNRISLRAGDPASAAGLARFCSRAPVALGGLA